MAEPDDSWSLITSNFVFWVDGMEIGRFSEVSGLSVTVATKPIEEGGQNHYTHKVPGKLEWPNLTLKRGVTKSDALFTWINDTAGTGFVKKKNKLERQTASLALLSIKGHIVRSWEFIGAFPVKWTGPTFSAGSDDIATEELEITHNGFAPTTW